MTIKIEDTGSDKPRLDENKNQFNQIGSRITLIRSYVSVHKFILPRRYSRLHNSVNTDIFFQHITWTFPQPNKADKIAKV
jgi:hypothetical protein